tara:strand:- start:1529 stop:4123 length:2595 start_codon:yes stop_codon:yes gene_type:complete
MKKLLFILFFFISLLITNISSTSEIIKYPLPEITNYPPSVNGGQTQTWDITQGKDGKLYFANSYGLLIYDGKQWKSLLLDNKYSARSVSVDQAGNIVIGSRGDFGFISNDGNGNIKFSSLKVFLDKESENRDIIYESFSLSNNEIFFRSKNKLFFYKDKKISIINKIKKKKFGVSRYINDKLFVAIEGLGIATIENKKILLIKNSEIFNDKTISGFHFSEESDLIIFTRKSGVYKKIKDEFIKIENDLINNIGVIYRTYNLKKNKIGLATYEGLYILDKKLKPLLHLDSNSGLRVDNVRSIFEDNNDNIWLGLNDGIVKINTNSYFKYLPVKETNLGSTVLSVENFNNHLYVGTSTNIKKLIVDDKSNLKQKFIEVAETKINTQVWSIYNNGNELLVGSNFGLGKIDINDNYLQLIDLKLTGRVYQIKESKIFKDYLYIRAKNGIFIVNKKYPDKYKILTNLKSAQYIKEVISKNEIWFAVQKKGVYRIKLISSDLKQLNKLETTLYDDSYLPKKGKIKIFKIYDQLIFKTQDKIYQFNENKETFYISKIFDPVPNIKEKVILKIEKTNNKTYWINFTERINDRRVQTFYELDESLDFKTLPFNSLAHHLAIKFFFLKDLTLMSSNEGIVVIGKINKELESQEVIFSSIKNNDKYILNYGPEKDLLNRRFITKNLFNYNENKLSFTVSLTNYINEKNNQFRYKLEGYENNYSKFSKNETITYTNLNPGDYKFYIQAISSEGLISDTNSFSFTINPPWWQSKIFYLSEILFFLILLSVTLFLKRSGKATIIATSISFMMILALFEYINFLVDPLILLYSNGVPVFTIFSKIILGVLLLPLERLMNKILDYISSSNFFQKLTSIKN